LKGSANLSQLRVAGVNLSAVKAELNYDNGLLRLDKLSGQVPWPDKAKHKPGTFAGSARVQVFPQGDLSADLTVDRFPLGVVPGGLGQGGLSGELRVTAPFARLNDPATWKGSGSAKAEKATVLGLPLSQASADLALAGGKLSVSNLKGRLAGG